MKQQNTTKRKNQNAGLHIIAIILVVITMVSSAIGLFAWSKYTSFLTNSATASIAKWSFDLKLKNGPKAGSAEETTGPIDLADTIDFTHVKSGTIAPGTNGEFQVIVNTGDTEVDCFYEVTIGLTNCPRNITFSRVDESNTTTVLSAGGASNTNSRTLYFSKYLQAKKVDGNTTTNENGKHIETITWNWPYELTTGSNEAKAQWDDRDKEDMGLTISMTITAKGTEVLENPKLPTTAAPTVTKNGNVVTVTNNQTVVVGTTLQGVRYGLSTDNETWEWKTTNSFEVPEGTVYIKTETTDSEGNVSESEVAILREPTATAKIKNDTTGQYEDVTITKGNVSSYIGKQVQYTNSNLTWRLFYVDFTGKYGDGEGAVYLKADYDSNLTRTLSSYSSSYTPASDTKVEAMNPLWAAQRGKDVIGTNGTWNNNEKSAAYLCDPAQWSTYYTGEAGKGYAIGSPSVEMYFDAVKQSGFGTIEYKYASSNVPGYKFIRFDNNTEDYWSGNNSIPTGTMFRGNGYWWLASPSANDANYVCGVSRNGGGGVGNAYCGFSNGVCPLVCLKSGI